MEFKMAEIKKSANINTLWFGARIFSNKTECHVDSIEFNATFMAAFEQFQIEKDAFVLLLCKSHRLNCSYFWYHHQIGFLSLINQTLC